MTGKEKHVGDLISQYLDKELSEEESIEFERHIEVCESCQILLIEHKKAEELIKSYVGHTKDHLTSEELFDFHANRVKGSWKKMRIEHHLESCPECKKLLQAVQSLHIDESEISDQQMVISTGRQNIRKRFRKLLFGKPFLPVGLAAAAAAIILVILLYPRPNPYGWLVQISPAEYIPAEIRSEELNNTFEKGMQAYLNGNFQNAATQLRLAAESHPENPQYNFFCGVTFLLLEQYDEGIACLLKDAVVQSVYGNEARWYISLAWLKVGEVQKATILLRELEKSSDRFSNQASYLLKRIKNTDK